METRAPFPTVSFLNLPVHRAAMPEVLQWMEICMHDRKPRFLCTLNAALLVWAQKDPFLKKTYQTADLATCDSTVFYYALKLLGTPVPEPLEACQIMFDFIDRHRKNYRFYFLGAEPETIEKAMANLKQKYPGIQIAGFHHGFFKPEEEEQIARQIGTAKPDCLFVGMSSPKKERFLKKHLQTMGVPVSLGVGGGIDILAGKYRLAPAWMHKIGLAWAYRLLLEPRRMWRRYLTTNTKFIWLFLKAFWKKEAHS